MTFAHHGPKPGIVDIGAGDADNARLRGDLAVEMTVQQRRKQLALREVAGGAEDDQIERRDGNEFSHVTSKLKQRAFKCDPGEIGSPWQSWTWERCVRVARFAAGPVNKEARPA